MKGLDSAAYQTKCNDAGYKFDAISCNCIIPQVCPTIKCAYAVDPVKCVCLPAPCELNTDKAAAAVSCNGDGFFFDTTTCSCVAVCPKTSQYSGLPTSDAYKKCSAQSGEFDKATCACKLPTMTCNTFAPCAIGQTLNPKTCACEQSCSDGRIYSIAKSDCITKGGSWDVLSCSCSTKCSSELTAKCAAIKGTVNTNTCSCDMGNNCDATTRDSATLASDCLLKNYVFDATTCQCVPSVSNEPVCKQGDYATLKQACFAKNANARWEPSTCTCTQPCFEKDATAAKSTCTAGQLFNPNTCVCEGGCSEFTADVALKVCAQKGSVFDGKCGCVNVCDVKDATGASDCKIKGGIYNYATCSCVVPTKCDDETAKKLQANCNDKGWLWNNEKCSCSDVKKIVLTLKDALTPELQQKIQQIASQCGVSFTTNGSKTELVVSTNGADALACSFDRDAAVKKLQSDDAVSQIELADNRGEILAATESPSAAALIELSFALIVVILSLTL